MDRSSRNLTVLALAVLSFLLFATPFVGAQSVEKEVGESFLDKALTFINQAANRLGKWMVEATNKIVGRDVASGLQVPLGYLGVLTLALLAFAAIEVARRVIWFIVGVGWALLIIRIVLEALSTPGST